MENNKFKLYRSGIYLADVYFGEDKILYRYRDIYTNQWSDIQEYDTHINLYKQKYDLDLVEIYENQLQHKTLDFLDQDTLKLRRGKVYEKYKKVDFEYEGEKQQAILWAERYKKFPLDMLTLGEETIGFIVTKREECIVLVKEGYEESTPQYLWEKAKVSEDGYGILPLGTKRVSMRDGVHLATAVWLPDSKEGLQQFPTIFIRTPYGKHRIFESYLRFVQRGYALVVQDTRGREESEGDFDSKGYESADGDDSLNWIYEQSWCDGNIGMIGASYLGYVQWAAASSGNPHLKALVSIVTAGSPFIDLPRKGGTMASGVLAWMFAMAEKEFHPEAMEREDWDQIVKLRPIKDIPKLVLGRNIAFWDAYMAHSTYDDFWDRLNWSTQGEKINVPALIVSGWFDDNGQGSLEAWKMNEKYQRDNMKMILGPWLHKANSTRDIGEIRFGHNAIRYDMDLLFQQWFDRYLKGMDTGVDQQPRVEYYNLGENQWKSAQAWTPSEAMIKRLYLDSGGNANSSDGDGRLIWERRYHSELDTYTYDPQNPVPHLIDLSENELNVPANYREVEKRVDVLVYTSEPLEEDMTIAGEVYAEIYAASSAKDTDWVVRLTDVDPQGNSRRLVDGVYRAKYIENFTAEKLLEDGEIRKYPINMFHTANTFLKGHRIRVEITSSAENLTFPNHNTGNPFATDVEYVVAKQKIYHSEAFPSHIALPIIPKDKERTV